MIWDYIVCDRLMLLNYPKILKTFKTRFTGKIFSYFFYYNHNNMNIYCPTYFSCSVTYCVLFLYLFCSLIISSVLGPEHSPGSNWSSFGWTYLEELRSRSRKKRREGRGWNRSWGLAAYRQIHMTALAMGEFWAASAARLWSKVAVVWTGEQENRKGSQCLRRESGDGAGGSGGGGFDQHKAGCFFVSQSTAEATSQRALSFYYCWARGSRE